MAKQSPVRKIATGVGLAALAAAAAGTYYFYGAGGEKHRKAAKAWAKRAKSEMMKKIKGMKSVSKQAYSQAVKEVMDKYKQVKNIDPSELAALGKELSGHWENISKDLAKLGSKAKTTVKKSAKSLKSRKKTR